MLVVLNHSEEKPEDALTRWADLAAQHGYLVVAPEWAQGKKATYGFSYREHATVLGTLRDNDALSVGLALACRVLGGRTPLGDLRLDHHALAAGMAPVRGGRCDRAMVRSIRDQIDELCVVLTPLEQDMVATVIAAVIWAVLDASVRDLDDTLVA